MVLREERRELISRTSTRQLGWYAKDMGISCTTYWLKTNSRFVTPDALVPTTSTLHLRHCYSCQSRFGRCKPLICYGAFLTQRSWRTPREYFNGIYSTGWTGGSSCRCSSCSRPVLLSFLQGQDSLLLLLIMALAVVELKRDRNFTAGCLLGCGLIKFHIILTLVVLVASLRRKGLLRGFALVFVILLLISAGISGWPC